MSKNYRTYREMEVVPSRFVRVPINTAPSYTGLRVKALRDCVVLDSGYHNTVFDHKRLQPVGNVTVDASYKSLYGYSEFHAVQDGLMIAGNGSSINYLNALNTGASDVVLNAGTLRPVLAYSNRLDVGAWPVAINVQQGCMLETEAERMYQPAKSANDTSPMVADPSAAPVCTPATTGGYMADATYDVSIAWLTKRNTTLTAYGATLPTVSANPVVSGGGGLGSIAVTVPAFPANVDAAIIYCSVSGQTPYVAGTFIDVAGGVFTITYDPAQLDYWNTMRYVMGTSMYTADVSSLLSSPTLSFTTHAIGGSPNSYRYSKAYVNPFGRHGGSMYCPPDNLSGVMLGWQRIDLAASTLTVNETVTSTVANVGSAADPVWLVDQRDSTCSRIRAVPELAAYLVVSQEANVGYDRGFVQLRSCIDHEILWSHPVPRGWPYAYSTSYPLDLVDYAVIDGAPFAYIHDIHQGTLEQTPIVMSA